MKLTEIHDQAAWDAFVASHPYGHPLQLWGWGEAKRLNGWRPMRLALVDGERWVGAVQVLLLPVPRTSWVLAYAPRGPVAEPGSRATAELLSEAADWVKAHKGLYLRVDPAWRTPELNLAGWTRTAHQIQMRETYVIDLRQSEDDILNAIDRKKRYLIRRGERDGVTVRRLERGDLGDMMKLYEETARRAGFGIHARHYYEDLSGRMGDASYLMVAEYDGKMVAFLWLLAAGETAIELYAGSNDIGRNLNVNYLLKWEAIRRVKADGYKIYDLNGRVSEGVSGFKAHFAPESVDYVGTWDRPLRPALYAVWEGFWPVIKRVGRMVRGRR